MPNVPNHKFVSKITQGALVKTFAQDLNILRRDNNQSCFGHKCRWFLHMPTKGQIKCSLHETFAREQSRKNGFSCRSMSTKCDNYNSEQTKTTERQAHRRLSHATLSGQPLHNVIHTHLRVQKLFKECVTFLHHLQPCNPRVSATCVCDPRL